MLLPGLCSDTPIMTLKAISYDPSGPSLSILDQLQLPHRTVWLSVPDDISAFAAIREMRVRGAPAIAIVAALSVAVDVSRESKQDRFCTPRQSMDFIFGRLNALLESRPTAVNLRDAVTKLTKWIQYADQLLEGVETSAAARAICDQYVYAAELMLKDDVRDNKSIGKEGARWIEDLSPDTKVSVLTHCNTG